MCVQYLCNISNILSIYVQYIVRCFSDWPVGCNININLALLVHHMLDVSCSQFVLSELASCRPPCDRRLLYHWLQLLGLNCLSHMWPINYEWLLNFSIATIDMRVLVIVVAILWVQVLVPAPGCNHRQLRTPIPAKLAC